MWSNDKNKLLREEGSGRTRSWHQICLGREERSHPNRVGTSTDSTPRRAFALLQNNVAGGKGRCQDIMRKKTIGKNVV